MSQVVVERPDELLEPEMWVPLAVDYFRNAEKNHPEMYNVARLAREEPDTYRRIQEKFSELDQLGDTTEEDLMTIVRQIDGFFSQAAWNRKGFTEQVLNEYGEVQGVLCPPTNFEPGSSPLALLGNFWVGLNESFRSPDGRPTYSISELQAISALGEEEIKVLRDLKLQ